MTAFVVLAAGRGTRIGRVGESLPKCLIPLDGRAVLSHQLALRPEGSRVVICVGYRGDHVREYVQLAHPAEDVTFITVEGWDKPHGGPGATLLTARDAVGDDHMVFTSCDTLWTEKLWNDGTWMGVAPIPAGTPVARWCRVTTYSYDGTDLVTGIIDKQPGHEDSLAYVGLGRVAREHLSVFWSGIESSYEIAGERQVSGGFDELLQDGASIYAERIHWTDVGDEASYRQAVARYSGYDWVKDGQATYVLPETGRVVKFHTDLSVLMQRWTRGVALAKREVVPHPTLTSTMMGLDYVAGVTAYDAIDNLKHQGADSTLIIRRLLTWVRDRLSDPVSVQPLEARELALRFYRDKTLERIELLSPTLRLTARDAVARIDWETLCENVRPVVWHGDLNFGNIIVDERFEFVGIDWRENFAGESDWGDGRYDVAKLLAGCIVHWGRARRGDFRPWHHGAEHARLIRASDLYVHECETIGALSLLNSAALHAPPLDEVLVARGCAWLDDAL